MNIHVVEVTPALAASWLKQNTSNRPLSRDRVAVLSRAMVSGEWVTTHQGIAFDTTGRLIDGQHRLHAVVESGVTVRLAVASDSPVDAYEVLDIQKTRTFSDALQDDPRYVQISAEIVRMAWNVHPSRPMLKTPHAILRPVAVQLFADDMRTTKVLTRVSVRAAAVLRVLEGHDPEKVKSLYSDLADLKTENMTPLCASFMRQVFMQMSSMRRAQATTMKKTDLLVRAWLAFDTDPDRQALAKLQVKDNSTHTSAMRAVAMSSIGQGPQAQPSNANKEI